MSHITLKELIPKNKTDIEAVEKLYQYSYQEIKPIVPQLLEWLQDINWPVATPMADYLLTMSDYLTDDIIAILRGKDEVWKYWCLYAFGINTIKPIEPRLLQEIEQIAYFPTQGEKEEEVQEVASKIMNKLKSQT
ncbi:DUF5071 domain-containing protein [Rhodocytophaga rosea]|uniref:DUF5071 domain-containing protein n=1 Tax=Rhodocytophaga rosea TaxID=2704465 RepID=A0A6C0GM90_9BACT|nr:DUF5071 domain-containing protein [Rhodocytophaga rosea]QHT69145.1 DUF5071 domain-containing protein [Rhodocytophaga rosea]